jgi:hypothetical protein
MPPANLRFVIYPRDIGGKNRPKTMDSEKCGQSPGGILLHVLGELCDEGLRVHILHSPSVFHRGRLSLIKLSLFNFG